MSVITPILRPALSPVIFRVVGEAWSLRSNVPTFYVDSVNGNDVNSGLTALAAKQTLSAAQAMLGAGSRISLAKGSRWRETFTVPVNNISLVVHGTGAAPIIDGRDIVVGTWVQHDVGTYPNVWSQTLVQLGTPDAGAGKASLYADGARLAYAANIAAVQSSGGWFSTNRHTATQTIYTKSLTNPNGNGVVYEFSMRNNGIAGHGATIVFVRSASISGPIEMIGHRGHYGSLSGGPGTQSRMLLRDGSIHHTVTEATLVEDLICIGFDPAQPGQSPYTAYIDNGAGRTHTGRRIIIIGDSAIPLADRPSGVFTHGSTAGFDEVVFDQCLTKYCVYGYSAGDTAPGIMRMTNSASLEDKIGISSGAPSTIVERSIFRLYSPGSSIGFADVGPGTATKTRIIRNCVFAQAGVGAANQAGIEVNDKGGSILIENCILYFPNTDNIRLLRFNGGGSGLTVTLRNCIIHCKSSGGRHLAVIGATTYIGENNIFVNPTGYWEVDNGSGGYTIKFSLAEWRAATGQDLNSTTGDPGWLGDPTTGDFRLNPGGLAASMGCGPTEHWDFNTRAIVAGPQSAWPTSPATLLESQDYIDDPSAWNFYP